jgi:hypothetical protein
MVNGNGKMVMMAGGGIGYWYLELGDTCTSSSTS